MVEIYNPYNGIGTVEWDRDATISGDDVIAHKTDIHFHARGGLNEDHEVIDFLTGDGPCNDGHYIDEGDEFTLVMLSTMLQLSDVDWPWSTFDTPRDPTDVRGGDGVIAFPGREWRENHHLDSLFSTASYPNQGWDPTEGEPESRQDQHEATLTDEEYHVEPENGGVSVLAHPVQYEVAPKDYVEFEKWSLEDGMAGTEIYGRRYGMDDDAVNLWDDLLTYWGPERMIWGFGASDSPSGEDAVMGSFLNRYYQTVLLTDDEFDVEDQAGSRIAVADKMMRGAMFGHRRSEWDPDTDPTPEVPKVTNVDVDHNAETITLGAHNYKTIEWISKGEVVATGETIDIDPTHVPYVRAELRTNPDGETVTQPFAVSTQSGSLGDATLGDVQIGT